jgi:hypothetical protein
LMLLIASEVKQTRLQMGLASSASPLDGTYRSGPCSVWIKVRNPAGIAVRAARIGIDDLSCSVIRATFPVEINLPASPTRQSLPNDSAMASPRRAGNTVDSVVGSRNGHGAQKPETH